MANSKENKEFENYKAKAISQPLIKNIFTADPSAHVFEGKVYIYYQKVIAPVLALTLGSFGLFLITI